MLFPLLSSRRFPLGVACFGHATRPGSCENIPRTGRFHLRGPRPANEQDTAEGSVSQRHCPRTPLSSAVQVRSGLVWGFSCQAVVLGCAESFLFGAGKAVFRPVACNQVPGARGRGQGTETLAELGGLPPSVACVSQRLDA